MREGPQFKGQTEAGGGDAAVPADEAAYFQSYYQATVRGTPTDRSTIGPVSEWESRFHYNAVENSILRAISRIEPQPEPAALAAWTVARQRRRMRLLDVGSGTGHWVDFGLDVLGATTATALELTPQMVMFLQQKYASRPDVRVESVDVVDVPPLDLGGPFDLVTAIGVMFHIIADDRWERAVRNLAAALRPGGLAFFGGDFGVTTGDRQVMLTDRFTSWKEYREAKAGPGRVVRRVRSLARWVEVAASAGLDVVDVVRTDRHPAFTVPENDVLVLRARR